MNADGTLLANTVCGSAPADVCVSERENNKHVEKAADLKTSVLRSGTFVIGGRSIFMTEEMGVHARPETRDINVLVRE